MLLSMTGFGEAHGQPDQLAVVVEVRSVNSRHFKLSYRASEGYAGLEPDVENLVRQKVRRGAVQLNLRVDREATGEDYRVNGVVLDSYLSQLGSYRERASINDVVRLDALLALPGVIEDKSRSSPDPHQDWPVIKPIVAEALEAMSKMRAAEGKELAADLAAQCRAIAAHVDQVEARAPHVSEEYRQRLTDRANKVMEEFGVAVQASDLVREVSLFIDRSDIREEIVRLGSHLKQFEQALELSESAGRKLEFIAQEMGREINTIGSKANDTEISRSVVEIKAALERIREQIQNVE